MRHTRIKKKSQFEPVMKVQPELLWSTVYEILRDNYSWTDKKLNTDMLELAMSLRNEYYIKRDLVKKHEEDTQKWIDHLNQYYL